MTSRIVIIATHRLAGLKIIICININASFEFRSASSMYATDGILWRNFSRIYGLYFTTTNWAEQHCTSFVLNEFFFLMLFQQDLKSIKKIYLNFSANRC